MKVRFFFVLRATLKTRMMMMMMSGGDIICAGDSLSPWAGGDLFEFERYFDIYLFSLRRRYFFAVVVVRARKSERERERERETTDGWRIRASLYADVSSRGSIIIIHSFIILSKF